MIKIEREKLPENLLDSKRITEALEKLKENNQITSTDFNKNIWQNEALKTWLHDQQGGKCCYCERKRDRKRDSDVEHFRPKGGVKESPNHTGYWWLAYSLKNLLIACKKCNQEYKKTHFPLIDESKRAKNDDDNLSGEQPLLINPLEENPEDFIAYDIPNEQSPEGSIMLKAVGKDERGKKTVNCLTGINSQEVMQERAKQFETYQLIMLIKEKDPSVFKRYREQSIHCSKTFSGLARFYFKSKGVL